MGMGIPIDWEPPVLTLDPGPNPRYVRLGTVISGTVTDNVGVERLVMRDANTGQEYFRGTLLPNNRFEIVLNFDFKNNGDKFSVEIAAYDKIGNVALENLTIIVDLRPPLVESAWIDRSPVKTEYLLDYSALKELETQDPRGEKSEYMHSYQNGWFTFTAKLSEDETRIEDVVLNIYDSNDFSRPVLTPVRETDTTLYAPKWIIKEEAIIAAGESLFGSEYRTKYYNDRERYYYFVSITAYDKSENQATLQERVEDQKFFCMWEQADEPKGIIDPIIGNTVYKKQPLPVQLFDDDSLDFAWVGLLTKDQWNGDSEIDTGVKIDKTFTNGQKLDFLKNRLIAGDTVYNWKYDPRYHVDHSAEFSDPSDPKGLKVKMREYVEGKKNVNDLLVNIETGTLDTDYGEFVLITIVQDKKLAPHPDTGDRDTIRSRLKSRHYEVNIIDDNMPLIVLDTVDTTDPSYDKLTHPGYDDDPELSTGNSPEENTFPKLQSDGKTFEINGYTLRENTSGFNMVERFRMAWIPDGVLKAGNEKDIIKQVENALRWYKDPLEPDKETENKFPGGVQYWVMDDSGYAATNGITIDGAGIQKGLDQELENSTGGSTPYIKQVFRKRFSVLYDADDLKSSAGYRNFTYNNIEENETKVFVFCAIDNMQKAVFRTIRLLPNKTPPDLSVYEITAMVPDYPIDELKNDSTKIPDVYKYSSTGNITNDYISARLAFNNYAYSRLRGISSSLADNNRTVPFQTYPRKTQIKYWINAEKSGDLAINSIVMQDITNAGSPVNLGSAYNSTDRALSYIEYFPEVTQRTFLFTARDTLGNEAQIQRTIAITNAATLINITTEKLSATYGIGERITLRANFDGRIILNDPSKMADIKLNIRYAGRETPPPLTTESDYIFKQIPCTKVNELSLEFDYIVQEGDLGTLETLYDDPAIYFNLTGAARAWRDRPISLTNGVEIIDDVRKDKAFTPGNITGFTWPNNANSLQQPVTGKQIKLDGIRPKIIAPLVVRGKTAVVNGAITEYYFKAGETILFTINADKDIKTSGATPPRLQYQIERPNTSTIAATGNAFIYQSPSTSKGMVFALEVNRANLTVDGRIRNFSLSSAGGTIVDDVGNTIDPSTVTTAAFETLLTNIRIFNDQTAPGKPNTTLAPRPNNTSNGSTPIDTSIGTTPENIYYYNTSPTLYINEDGLEPYSGQIKEYSLNGGLSWVTFPNNTITEWVDSPGAGVLNIKNSINSQPWSLQTRLTDRSGNVGPITEQLVYVNVRFPEIKSVNVEQPKGTFTAAAGQNSLTFVLNFDGNVRVTEQANVTVTLTNRNNVNNNNTGGTNNPLPSYQIRLTANPGQTANTTSIRFTWTGIGTAGNRKEMLNGLYISAVDLTGLSDQFGNAGGTGTAASSGAGAASDISMTNPVYYVANLAAGYIVDTISPRVEGYTPVFEEVLSGSGADKRRIITIKFNEKMMKGSGTITVKPASDSLIPPVFENDGYYLGTDDNRYKTVGPHGAVYTTRVDGFYDVYNSSLLNADDRNYLTQSTGDSWATLRTNVRTGRDTGPYQRLTQGLKNGDGYDGDYSNTSMGARGNYSGGLTDAKSGPNPQSGFLVPDTDTKWVLNYQLRINETGDTDSAVAVDNIRKTLTKAKFRWQEIDVANVEIEGGDTIKITLNQPLLKGLHWELSYPAGAFTDEAGNSAVAEASHTFWTDGVQAPVIRVNRRSYDARAVGNPLNNLTNNGNNIAYPAEANLPGGATGITASWDTVGFTVTDTTGWGINDFNTVHYRIETETPGATLTYGVYGDGRDARRDNKASVTTGWTRGGNNPSGGNIGDVNDSVLTDRTWYMAGTALTNGEWILSNLVRRANSEYTVIENGNNITRKYTGTYRGYRSYNCDAKESILLSWPLPNVIDNSVASTNNHQGIVTFDKLEAGKSYIAAEAQRDTYTARGYEGVFRTVIALASDTATVSGTRAALVEGSNIKNGMPSVAGFPVRDAEETGDTRYVKVFYRNYGPTSNYELLWVSTEIVCEWYFIKFGGTAANTSHMQNGEVTNYLMVGYGDLTWAYGL
jgi:hypothetical protein